MHAKIATPFAVLTTLVALTACQPKSEPTRKSSSTVDPVVDKAASDKKGGAGKDADADAGSAETSASALSLIKDFCDKAGDVDVVEEHFAKQLETLCEGSKASAATQTASKSAYSGDGEKAKIKTVSAVDNPKDKTTEFVGLAALNLPIGVVDFFDSVAPIIAKGGPDGKSVTGLTVTETGTIKSAGGFHIRGSKTDQVLITKVKNIELPPAKFKTEVNHYQFKKGSVYMSTEHITGEPEGSVRDKAVISVILKAGASETLVVVMLKSIVLNQGLHTSAVEKLQASFNEGLLATYKVAAAFKKSAKKGTPSEDGDDGEDEPVTKPTSKPTATASPSPKPTGSPTGSPSPSPSPAPIK